MNVSCDSDGLKSFGNRVIRGFHGLDGVVVSVRLGKDGFDFLVWSEQCQCYLILPTEEYAHGLCTLRSDTARTIAFKLSESHPFSTVIYPHTNSNQTSTLYTVGGQDEETKARWDERKNTRA